MGEKSQTHNYRLARQPSLQAVKTGYFRLLYLDGEIHQITSNSRLQSTISRGNSQFCPELGIKTVWIILEQYARKTPAEVPYRIRCCLILKQEFIWFSLKERKVIKAEEVMGTWGQCHKWQGLPASLLETGNLFPNLKGKSCLSRFHMDTTEFFQALKWATSNVLFSLPLPVCQGSFSHTPS